MPRELIPFATDDLSAFARALRHALAARESAEPPTHVEMLNLLARAAGHRNLQALRSAQRVPRAARTAEDRVLAPLSEHAKKALRLFDARGRMVQWPSRFAVQRMAMWILWTRFEPRRVYREKDVNEVLKAANAFDDHVTLRRELVNHHLLGRKSDCSEYRRLPARPDSEVRALLAAWKARRRAEAGETNAERTPPLTQR